MVPEACPLRCSYCHEEGGFSGGAGCRRGLDPEVLTRAVRACVAAGMRKVKFLGGEPFLYSGLAEVIGGLRRQHPDLDISAISSGVVPGRAIERCLAAGLSRSNVSVHGWRPGDFALRGGSARMHQRRHDFINRLLQAGRPLKANYVYTGPEVEADLAAMLAWAADKPLVVGLLDDLSNPALGPRQLVRVLTRLRGAPVQRLLDLDPHSLSTTHLRWEDGLHVEIKDQHLGQVAPWRACARCPRRGGCREGVFAARLTPAGRLQLCMDRPDLSIDLLALLRHRDTAAAGRQLRDCLKDEAAGAHPRKEAA